jgi:hypothetical protein
MYSLLMFFGLINHLERDQILRGQIDRSRISRLMMAGTRNELVGVSSYNQSCLRLLSCLALL